MREYAILFHRFSAFACLDDKHKVKVGEPGFPIVAAERGRQVLVHSSTSFEVGDHDFTKISIIPSVSFDVEIPDNISGSWYTGQVHVLFKDSTFEPSSPSRHGTEIASILGEGAIDYPMLFMYICLLNYIIYLYYSVHQDHLLCILCCVYTVHS